jgi:hypothetical protein
VLVDRPLGSMPLGGSERQSASMRLSAQSAGWDALPVVGSPAGAA